MQALFNIQHLIKLSNIFKWLVIVFIFLTGSLEVAKLIIDRKIDNLRTRESVSIKCLKTTSNIIKWIAIILIFIVAGLEVTKLQFDKKIDSTRTQKLDSLEHIIDDQNKKIKNIEGGIKRRKIPNDKRLLIIQALSKYKGEKILISTVFGDQEAYSFAYQMKLVFEEAGWEVVDLRRSIYDIPMKGLIILINNRTQEKKGLYLISVLKSIGLECRGEINENQAEDFILIVGTK